LAKLFGFVQFDFAGTLPLGEGRYLAGEPGSGEETVLVLQRLSAAAAERRRRRGRPTPADPDPALVSLTRATVVRAPSPFEERTQAARWLDEACDDEDSVEALTSEGAAILNRALHAQAVAAADAHGRQVTAEQAERILIGYGSGEETSEGRFTDARQIDIGPAGSRRRRREEQLRPQERVAAVLRGREQLDACETLLLRARADLDAGRTREAELQLRIGVEALLTDLDGAVDDPDHEKDMTTLRERQAAAQQAEIGETLAIAERILRRRRVLGT